MISLNTNNKQKAFLDHLMVMYE